MPRFVILEHDYPSLHWDLMLETGEVLRSWRLLAPPQTGQDIAAEPNVDHRKLYLDYEGPVGGGRGSVVRWDHGTYTPEFGLESPGATTVVMLEGERLRGTTTLTPGVNGWSFRLEEIR